MRRLFLVIQLIILCTLGYSQKTDDWVRFIADGNRFQVQPSDIFMVEAKRTELFKSDQLDILRSIDETHHIIKAKSSSFQKSWQVTNDWKLDLSDADNPSHFYIVTTSSFDQQKLLGFEIVNFYESSQTYLIKGDIQDVRAILLEDHEVIHITDKVFQPTVESRVIDLNLNPNRVNKIHHVYPLLNGSSETVSIQENRYNEADIDLLNRSISSGLESEIMDNHATEMATIIAGRGNSFITGRGVANDVTLTSSDFFDAMPDSDFSYEDLNILTQNHSYGIPRTSNYGVEARAFDQSAFTNKNLLHVFSSGNAGLEVSTDGTYEGIEGYANLTGNIKMTKNSLVVGSVDTVENVPAFVSRGPAYDGRIKPEVVAYSVVGSSNSAALVSGVSVLLQQQFRETHTADMPSALVKALIINGADDVGEKGPDFLTGFGNVDAYRSVEALRNTQYFSGSVEDGEVETFDLDVPVDAINLKVTMVWTDPAANINDNTALVNDLDLRLDDGVTTTFPWVLDEAANTEALSAAAIRGEDHLNNVEQVTVANPEESYSIEVEGTSVSGSQEYFIAWQYDLLDSFDWDFPTGSDNMPYNGETGSYFRWSTTISGTGELAITEDGDDWIVLNDQVDLSLGRWRWNNPIIFNDVVKARMEIGAETFETDFFSVSEPLSASVGFNCADSLMLRWNPSENAVSYTVYSLGEEELEMEETVADTFLVVSNTTTFPSRNFSIQPNLAGGQNLLPTPTFDYALQGVECFVFSFFQTVALDTGIYLNLTLGTTYGMEEIVLERSQLNDFVEVVSFENPSTDFIQYLDDSPNQGYNEHRAIIRFQNGEELILSAGASFYLTGEPLRLFPNPASVDGEVSIITREFDDATPVLEFIDSEGSLVHRQIIQGTQDVISLVGLKPGLYFYRLLADGAIHSGRMLVR